LLPSPEVHADAPLSPANLDRSSPSCSSKTFASNSSSKLAAPQPGLGLVGVRCDPSRRRLRRHPVDELEEVVLRHYARLLIDSFTGIW
jgi:hypothetical protein